MTARRLTRREFLKSSAAILGGTAAAAGGAGLGGTLLSGCGPRRTAAEITLAASAEDVPDAVIAAFNRKFAPYHVTRVALPAEWLASAERLGESLAADAVAAPDVVALPGVKMAGLGQRAALRDLAELFQASREARGADLFGVDGYFTTGAQRWGLALAWSPDYLVWANARLWQAAGVKLPTGPLGLEAWRGLAEKLSAVQAGGLPVFGADFLLDFPAMLWLAETLDPPARIFSADGRRLELLARPGFVELARFVLDWKKQGGIPFQRWTDPLKANIPECS